jgi:hypothetical protein
MMMRATTWAAGVVAVCLAWRQAAYAQPTTPFSASFSQLADESGNFDYSLRLGTTPTSASFSSARWTSPTGTVFDSLGQLTITRDTFAELGGEVFGGWNLEFTPSFPASLSLGTAPRSVAFSIAEFELAKVHTSLATIVSPAPGAVIPLPPGGGAIDFVWTYQNGVPQSGRTFSITRSGLDMDGAFLGGYPEVYRVQTVFQPGKTAGTATARGGRSSSNPTTLGGSAEFLELFSPGSSWANLSAVASYSIVATPEPEGVALAVAALAPLHGAWMRVRGRRGALERPEDGS